MESLSRSLIQFGSLALLAVVMTTINRPWSHFRPSVNNSVLERLDEVRNEWLVDLQEGDEWVSVVDCLLSFRETK